MDTPSPRMPGEDASDADISFCYRYKRAYNSLKACPLEFSHPSEAQQLTGLGPRMCDRLTEKLKEYCQEHGLPMPEPPQKGKLYCIDTLQAANLRGSSQETAVYR